MDLRGLGMLVWEFGGVEQLQPIYIACMLYNLLMLRVGRLYKGLEDY